MSISTLAPWFGSNRMNAHKPAEFLANCEWVGVGFAGGMCEVPHFKARTVVVNDKHRHIINLARTAAHPVEGPELYRKLRRVIFHPDTLADAQRYCREQPIPAYDPQAAFAYFVCCWMGRSGVSGTDAEFKGNLALRWNAGGGDSAVRYFNAVKFLREFRRACGHCTFSSLDVFDFLDNVHDKFRHGVYLDPPWPDDGDGYVHKFDGSMQRRLAARLLRFENASVVVRYGDHPLVRELYPESRWEWHTFDSRTSANKAKPEVLLVLRHGTF